jgi:hypothetical protein
MSFTKYKKFSAAEKVTLFRTLFAGRADVYGTYDPATGRSWQVKKSVNDETVLSHLKGIQPYGVYLLNGCTTKAITVDFDLQDPFPPFEFQNTAKHYQLPAYIEASKSKGFHVWIFFNGNGVQAAKARMVVKHILEEIEHPDEEIFPKQDFLDNEVSFGNFINAPLFGSLVPQEKTVFIDPTTMKPYPDQWAFLYSIERADDQTLDDIIEINSLAMANMQNESSDDDRSNGTICRFGLPRCAQKMLRDGVTKFQRVSCFRLAVHLKRLGLPHDLVVSALKTWALKNSPSDGRRIITDQEIIDQTSYAFSHHYTGYGCDSEAVRPYCHEKCPLKKDNIQTSTKQTIKIDIRNTHGNI